MIFLWIKILLHLSSVTEERDRLKTVVHQLKQQKNVEAWTASVMTDGTLQHLESSVSIKEWQSKTNPNKLYLFYRLIDVDIR